MADGKAAVVVGIGLGALALIYLATRAKAAPPPPPPPGLATLYGQVKDAITGEAISGVLVSLNGLETHTNGGGDYAFTDLEPGAYTLTFSKEGYETAVY